MAVALAGVLLAGCSAAGPGVHPFKDDSIPQSAWTSPSEETVRASGVEPMVRHRDWPATEARIEPMGVPHWPLWFEDPFEDKGSSNPAFAGDYEDAIAVPYSFGRLLVNTMFWPVSATLTPPGTTMVSDGYLSRQGLGYDHDALPRASWPVGDTPLEVE
ncbi:MAG: hypothetical protein JXA69_09710 [Phycisphaerae bacterium]|nr:hypothetical protein [Phycisphaerae bacterium]